jgi:hypothetical protein
MRCRFAELLSGSKNTSKIHPSYRQLLSNLDSCAFAKEGINSTETCLRHPRNPRLENLL